MASGPFYILQMVLPVLSFHVVVRYVDAFRQFFLKTGDNLVYVNTF